LARQLYEETKLPNLCLAGGVAYNSVANGRILRETPFTDVYVQPASGDSGGAVGAALYAYHVALQRPRAFVMDHAYWGKQFSEDEIRQAIARQGLSAVELTHTDTLLQETAHRLVQGQVIGWYQGRSEWGPRALGNRSILVKPFPAEMKDHLNSKVKFREAFRPFAPAILSEQAGEYFQIGQESPHMLIASRVRPEKKSEIPATVHVDDSCRVQTVSAHNNPRFRKLLEAFYRKTQCPVLLNTSFNVKGQPMINAPEQAIACMVSTAIDVLVLGDFYAHKKKEPVSS
jgi:carbamoyltransferase